MPQYKNKPEGFGAVKSQLYRKGLPVMLIALVTGLSISYATQKGVAEEMYTTMFTILFFAVVLAFSFWRALQKQKAVYNSYLLTIDDGYIVKEQATLNTGRLKLGLIEIIEQDEFGNLFVSDAQKQSIVVVSANIESYAEVKELLGAFKPITTRKKINIFQKYWFVTVSVPCILMVVVYISDSKIIVAAAGIPLIAVMIWGIYKIRTNKHFANKSKPSIWMLLIVILSITAMVYYKLFG
ncbi:hypothetical protein [Mucilaginibacter pedocola]|uniref:Uncharacterized protein n=1 Tax=Mucilaginibacter pedocola TaxID=1792845 RepID=A0A1S9PH85_9SPHI|nr:hypothetical protein [Mucilaginibacter pedocola]OOQ60324.1 hypothetical protein BC343_25190 [Mucilaginibacter pedocola]